jgi:hypothetical protein
MDAYDKFERNFQENFELRSPVFDDELKELYLDAKRGCLEEFQRVAVGEVQKQYLVELKDKIKHKYNQIRMENEKVAEVRLFNQFIYYSYIVTMRDLPAK